MRFICFLVSSGSLIGMMLLVRMLLRRRISQGVLYALWLIPAVRLLFPFTLIPLPVLPEAAVEVAEEVSEAAGEVSKIGGKIPKATEETSEIAGEDLKKAKAVSEITEGVPRAAEYVRGTAGEEPEVIEDVPVANGSNGKEDASDNINIAENIQNIQNTQNIEKAGIPEELSLASGQKDKAAGTAERCLLCIWAAGSILCGYYVFGINRRLKKSIKQMKRLREERLVPVYIWNEPASPCLFGLFHPCILLSEQTAENGKLCSQALLHEETHYRQKDHIWTAFRIFLCVVYWWNPLVWLGAACARDDAEFACDARALKGALLSEKKAYGYALLEIAQGVHSSGMLMQGITPVSGKGKNMKRRLERIVSENGKTRLWMLPACFLCLLFLSGFCFPAQRVRAESGTIRGTEAVDETKETTVELPGVKKETTSEQAETENGSALEQPGPEKEMASEQSEGETAILLHPQKHRTGYREPDINYTALAHWLTDLSGMPGEQRRVEALAKRALRELYDLTGYQVEKCYYGYNEIGMLVFARSEEDMAHSRVFYSYSPGEKDGYDMISSIDIANAQKVWYSEVRQLALPENAEAMTKEELAVWFLEHSPLCPEGMAAKIESISEGGSLKLKMEDGTFYEIDLDMEILAVNNIYGPYPKDAYH